jgi:hypothetical protein
MCLRVHLGCSISHSNKQRTTQLVKKLNGVEQQGWKELENVLERSEE